MSTELDYDKIMSDRGVFNQFVYTPLSEAISFLEERSQDKGIIMNIENFLDNDVPSFLNDKRCAVLGRHVATPNHENRMFIKIAKEFGFYPVFFEYHDDKFVTNNSYKHSLGQLHIIHEAFLNSKGEFLYETIDIVDFKKYNGKKIKEVVTLWEEPLVDFHRRLFGEHNLNLEDFHLYDGSEWLKRHGNQKAIDFYVNFLMLFVGHGILFENFLTSKDSDGEFTKNVVLPAIERIKKITGLKPLIVPIGPLEIETDEMWFHHLPLIKKTILNNAR